MFEVHHSTEYDHSLGKLDIPYQQILLRFEQRLAQDAYIGKPLGFPYLREKKFDDKRAIFFVYPEPCKVLMLTIVDKHTQKKVLKWIRQNIDNNKNAVPN